MNYHQPFVINISLEVKYELLSSREMFHQPFVINISLEVKYELLSSREMFQPFVINISSEVKYELLSSREMFHQPFVKLNMNYCPLVKCLSTICDKYIFRS